MNWIKRVMERGQPPVAAPYATTPNGYPFPLRSWPPDAAIDIQNLANAIDTDVTAKTTTAWASVSWAGTQSMASGWNICPIPAGATVVTSAGASKVGNTIKGPVGAWSVHATMAYRCTGVCNYQIGLGIATAVQLNGMTANQIPANQAEALTIGGVQRLSTGELAVWTYASAAMNLLDYKLMARYLGPVA